LLFSLSLLFFCGHNNNHNNKPSKKNMESIEELEEKLANYKDQFQQIEAALKVQPNSEDLLKLKSDLIDVINLTEDFLRLNRKKAVVTTDSSRDFTNPAPSSPPTTTTTTTPASKALHEEAGDVAPSGVVKIGDMELRVGSRCMAFWEEDGLMYEAVIEELPSPENGNKFSVTYVGYGNRGKLTSDKISPLLNNKKKRDAPDEELSMTSDNKIVIPKYLKILPTDSEEVRQSKKRRIKAIKSQMRAKQLEEERTKQKTAWQEFNLKGSKLKTSSVPGRKESIFKSPDSVQGKVGVTGSGKGLTPSPSFNATVVERKKPKLSNVVIK
jgi:survival-of-motor-neuron-related-splicing factor 30